MEYIELNQSPFEKFMESADIELDDFEVYTEMKVETPEDDHQVKETPIVEYMI